jgi:hypothetical protein
MPSVKDLAKKFASSAAINSQLTLGDMGAMKTASGRVANAFLDPQLVMLPAKTRVYKFNTYPSLRPDDSGNVTPWWTSFEPYDVDPGWYAKLAMAKTFGISVRELGRVTSAITESWNSCEFLYTITLTVDIWVMYGRFRQMSRTDTGASKVITGANRGAVVGPIRDEGKMKTRNLPGGGRQFFIPNLKPAYYTSPTVQSLVQM